MFDRDLTPDPLSEPRYGVAMTAGLGLFDTAGWAPPAPGMYAGFGDDSAAMAAQSVRRDYGPKGCVGAILGASFVVLCVAVYVLRLVA